MDNEVKDVFKSMLIRIKDVLPVFIIICTGVIPVCMQEVAKEQTVLNAIPTETSYLRFECFQMVRFATLIAILLLGFNMAVVAIDLYNRPIGAKLIRFDLAYNLINIGGYMAIIFVSDHFAKLCTYQPATNLPTHFTYQFVITVFSVIMIGVYAVNTFVMLKRDKHIVSITEEILGVANNITKMM